MRRTSLLPLLMTLLAVSAFVFAPLTADPSDSAAVECNGMTVSLYVSSEKIAAGESETIEINVFNNNSGYASIYFEQKAGDGSPVKVAFSNNNIMLQNGKGITLKAILAADKYAHQGTYDVTVDIKVAANDGTIGNTTMVLKTEITSAYSSGTAFNKIIGVFANPLPAPLNDPIVTSIISFIIWAGIAALVYLIFSYALKFVLKDSKEERMEILKKTGGPLIVCVIIYGISNCLRVVGANEILVATVVDISLLLYIGIGAIIAWGVYKTLVSHLFHKMETDGKLDGVDTSLVPLFNMIGKIVIAITAVAWILAILGFNLMAILTGAGIAGLAISLGAQNTLNEFFSGLTLLITRPFKAGDMIRLGTGTEILEVKHVGLMNTRFKNWANYEHFTMPNSAVSKSTIVNLTGKTRAYRVFLYFGVAYDSDLEMVKKLMKDAAYEHPQVIVDGSFDKPDVRLTSFDSSCITLRLAAYVNDFEDNGVISGELRESVFKKFNDNGVEIPFDQLDVHIKNVE